MMDRVQDREGEGQKVVLKNWRYQNFWTAESSFGRSGGFPDDLTAPAIEGTEREELWVSSGMRRAV